MPSLGLCRGCLFVTIQPFLLLHYCTFDWIQRNKRQLSRQVLLCYPATRKLKRNGHCFRILKRFVCNRQRVDDIISPPHPLLASGTVYCCRECSLVCTSRHTGQEATVGSSRIGGRDQKHTCRIRANFGLDSTDYSLRACWGRAGRLVGGSHQWEWPAQHQMQLAQWHKLTKQCKQGPQKPTKGILWNLVMIITITIRIRIRITITINKNNNNNNNNDFQLTMS